MKYKRLVIAVSVLVVIFGGVAAAKELGWWQTTGSRKIFDTSGGSGGNRIEYGIESDHKETGDGIEEEHSLNEVSGSTTVGQALDMGIPADVLEEYLGDISDKNALVKDLIAANGLSFGKTKTILNEYITSD